VVAEHMPPQAEQRMGGPRQGYWEGPGKRAFDIVAATATIVFFAPFFLLITVLLYATAGGPVIHLSKRVGRNGERFHAYKFRTMYPNSDEMLAKHLEANPVDRLEWERTHKLRRDPRVHWVGSLLRKSSLDELPQLFNVLLGQMSLVGPRPILEDDLDAYGSAVRTYVKLRPGLTGLWQVSGRSDTTFEQRVALDSRYYRDLSLFLDICILIKTVAVVVTARGAY
jgi:exopolysaccharide production protein ExoY